MFSVVSLVRVVVAGSVLDSRWSLFQRSQGWKRRSVSDSSIDESEPRTYERHPIFFRFFTEVNIR